MIEALTKGSLWKTFVDLILVVDRGTIVASGAHETLLHTSPLYQELWNAQQVNPAARVEYR